MSKKPPLFVFHVVKSEAFTHSLLHDPETVWQKLTLDWYGQGERTLEICTGTALWYRYGYDPLPIRWILTRDPLGKRPRHPPFFLPTPPRRQNRSSAIS